MPGGNSESAGLRPARVWAWGIWQLVKWPTLEGTNGNGNSWKMKQDTSTAAPKPSLHYLPIVFPYKELWFLTLNILTPLWRMLLLRLTVRCDMSVQIWSPPLRSQRRAWMRNTGCSSDFLESPHPTAEPAHRGGWLAHRKGWLFTILAPGALSSQWESFVPGTLPHVLSSQVSDDASYIQAFSSFDVIYCWCKLGTLNDSSLVTNLFKIWNHLKVCVYKSQMGNFISPGYL